MKFTFLLRHPVIARAHFIVTNRIPRRFVTKMMGKFSKIEQPLIRDLSLWIWQQFTELDLEDAKKSKFSSVHDCFTRELRPGSRPLAMAPDTLVSPCDGIIGGCGRIEGSTLVQAKGITYTLDEVLCDPDLARAYRDGSYVTLRLTSAMYHRFHAPHDLMVEHLTYVAGDTWNTSPSTVARIDKLYCRNERAVLRCRLAGGQSVAIVPVAAILVASIRLHFLDVPLNLDHPGPNDFTCSARFAKGQEMGWFEHGSTILVFAPRGFELASNVQPGQTVRMGRPLLQMEGKLTH